MENKYREKLIEMKDEKYQKFSSGLIPNVGENYVIGVRIPKLRKMAKEIAKNEAEEFFKTEVGETLEEKLLSGFVIAYFKEDTESKKERIANFIPYIDSWSVCDSFVNSLKFIKEERKTYWQFILPYFKSSKPYYVRFALVASLNFYREKEYTEQFFKILESIDKDDFYVKTAEGWAIAEFYSAFPDETYSFLKKKKLKSEVINMAVKKICESRKIDEEYKQKAKKLKN